MKKYLISILAIATLGMTSCDNYLDVNDNPNSPSASQLGAGMILPGVEMSVATQYGMRLRILAGYYGQYYAQLPGTSNYSPFSAFTNVAATASSVYSQLNMRAIGNANTVIAMAEAEEDWGTKLAATVMRVASYQLLVDMYGSTPYSEAGDINNGAPKYDEGSEIYPKLVAELDDALQKVTDASTVCTNFLFPGENATNWIRTANALKLRLLMRMSGVSDVKSQVAALITENNFPKSDVAWTSCWANASANANPFFYEEFWPGQQNNVCLNVAFVRAQEDAQDGRLGVYWDRNKDGDFMGWVSSNSTITSSSKYFNSALYSRPAMKYNSPVYVVTVAETEFFISEYYQDNANPAQAQAHYEAAVKASFTNAGLSEADAQTVIAAYPYDTANYDKNLGIQKWLHLGNINTFEGYCEMRRLGYPTFGTAQGTDIYVESADNLTVSALVPGELYTPIKVDPTVGADKLLQRWMFASSSADANPNVPTYAGATTPIFWAK